MSVWMARGVLIASVLSWLSCASVRHAPGTAYYESFGGYNLPLRPIREISEEDARRAPTHYKATYDQRGHLVALEKWHNSQLVFRHDYEYAVNGDPIRAKVSQPGRETVVRDL